MADDSALAHARLMKACEELLGWSLTLREVHSDRMAFLEAWLPVVVHLLQRAAALDVIRGDHGAFYMVVARCNVVLSRLGYRAVPHEAYLRAVAMQTPDLTLAPRAKVKRRATAHHALA